MTASKATVGLYVAVVGLVTAVLTLVGATVRLTAAGLQALTARLQAPRAPVPAAAAAAAPVRAAAPAPAGDQLTCALTGLGFKPAEVRRFVATLGPRAGTEPLQGLIKEGLRALAS